MNIYCMLACVTYSVFVSVTVSGAQFSALHQSRRDRRPSLESHDELRKKVTVRGCVELRMSGERSDCYSVMRPPSTWKPLITGLMPRD